MLIDELFGGPNGLATTADLSTVFSTRALARHVEAGAIVRVCHGVYASSPPDVWGRLAALELMTGQRMVACMNTAAGLYGFDTEGDSRVHVLDPAIRMRPNEDVVVHQRLGAPLTKLHDHLATAPAWTAVEVARTLRRPRALAILDAALHVNACSIGDLRGAVDEQKGRRGIVQVRELLEHADGRAESPMETEARLVFIDGGLPMPELQYEIVDRCGDLWRVDFAWPDAMLVAEYESMEWHATPEALRHDRLKVARLQECGWRSHPIVVDDVRRRPLDLVGRVFTMIGASC